MKFIEELHELFYTSSYESEKTYMELIATDYEIYLKPRLYETIASLFCFNYKFSIPEMYRSTPKPAEIHFLLYKNFLRRFLRKEGFNIQTSADDPNSLTISGWDTIPNSTNTI